MTRIAFFAAALLASLAAAEAVAQPAPTTSGEPAAVGTVAANLNITPKRVTFDRNRRTSTIYLFNQGGAPATVDITMVDRVMLPNGQIIAAEESKSADQKAVLERLKSAKDMVQVAPRRITLQPGHGQTVRLRVGNIPDAPADAEYRTHLTVTTIPPRDAGVTAAAAAGETGGNQLSFRVTAVYGLSIPVIVRAGAPEVKASIEHARVETESLSLDGRSAPKPTPVLVLDLVRQGGNSLYGNVEVRPAGAKAGAEIGAARGVGVYTEIDRRTVRIPLMRAPSAGEKLEVTFTDDDSSPGKVLAKSAL